MGEVINLAEYRRKKKGLDLPAKHQETLSFEEAMRKNQLNKERVERERARNNKGVVRSHRLSGKKT